MIAVGAKNFSPLQRNSRNNEIFMKIILIKDFGKTGKEGDIINAKDGYARNFLIPQGIALRATAKSSKKLEEFKRRKAKVAGQKKQEFLNLKERIDKLSLTVTVQAKDDEELYGAIGEAQIVKLLSQEGIKVDKAAIILKEPVKRLGVYTVAVNLHPEVEASFRLWVMKK